MLPGGRAANLVHIRGSGYSVSRISMSVMQDDTDATMSSRLEATIWAVPSMIENAVAVRATTLV